MKPIDRTEIMDLAAYETIRERFRARVIAEKKVRRVQLGPKATALFENRDTVLLQIQEMLRTERITREAAVQHEIDTYNETLPGDEELSLTVMIEIPDKLERDAFLGAAVGFEKHVWLVGSGEQYNARSIERGADATDRTTAVHYLKIGLSKTLADTLRKTVSDPSATPRVELTVDHPSYTVRSALSPATLVKLGEDLLG